MQRLYRRKDVGVHCGPCASYLGGKGEAELLLGFGIEVACVAEGVLGFWLQQLAVGVKLRREEEERLGGRLEKRLLDATFAEQQGLLPVTKSFDQGCPLLKRWSCSRGSPTFNSFRSITSRVSAGLSQKSTRTSKL